MIWIRADANREIGTGHVMRCLSIAAALKQKGKQVCFLTADEAALPLLQEREQDYRVLHTDYRNPEGELEILESVLAGGQKGFFLADSYYVTKGYFEKAGKWMPVGYMDDMGRKELPVDVLINYNIFAESSLYGETKDTRLLLGPAYAPLREDFLEAPYEVRPRASRVLVTTGGSDRYNLAVQFLERALENPGTMRLNYSVVSGAYNVHLRELQTLERAHGNVRIYRNVRNMKELMQESDIAVTAGGSTMYELSAVGVPLLCFSFVDNQERIVEGFKERGLTVFGGNYLTRKEAMLDELVEKTAMLAADSKLRLACSKRLRQVVDGRGAERIAKVLDDMSCSRACAEV
ncbi:MAG: UDP-2,4-diacetamido-2,4,6-trideoxy-beta-L-altropyranose hydrolase [Lachnospiraceae bacterium]|jgi:UDP-2,4-diacetamido-2,4,6-trideoxy-beta-L-altropyranose hydrolase|nr:UDP-2,4-diacetamido-2,4,6-trideoxy-beta-L-altropyranose hydrolase [Lachnospiraceae bacterium]